MPRSITVVTFLAVAVAACASSSSTETISITVHEGTALSFDLSADGRTIVFDMLGQLWEMPSGGGVAQPITYAVRDTAEDSDPSYSPDGKRIVFRGERHGRTGLWLLDRGTAAPRQLTQLAHPDGYEGNATWSPDGASLVFARVQPPNVPGPWRSRLARLDVASGQVSDLTIASEAGPNLRDPAWEPSGRRFAVIAGSPSSAMGGRMWSIDAGTGRATALGPANVRAIAPAFAPDGRHLAYFAPDSLDRMQIWVSSVDSQATQPALRLTTHADVSPTRVRWSSDGKELLYSADGRFWKVASAGGTPSEIPFTATLSFERARRTLPAASFPVPGNAQHVRAFMGLAISPDARSVAMIALGKLWVMPLDSAAREIASIPLTGRHLVWSPDGATLTWGAGAPGDEDLFSADVKTGKTRQITALKGSELSPMYSPDGQHLAFLHRPSEDKTIVRVAPASIAQLSDTTQTRSFVIARGGDIAWSPASDALLLISGGWSPARPTKGEVLRLTGKRDSVGRVPDSPLTLSWSDRSIVFVRHARLWRAPFDTTGMRADPEPLGTEPAMYASVARDGSILFISEGGLRLRSPNGQERSLGWPLSYTPPVADPTVVRNVRIIDGRGAAPAPPQDVLIERGRITRISAAGAQDTAGRRVVDAAGRFVIPGLMDLHAHIYRPDLLPGFSYFGVTTVRDQGSSLSTLVSFADAIAAGQMDGPRVGYGGFQFYSDWAFDAEDQQGVEPEADPDHAARAIALAHAFGSQHIKARTFRRWDINARFIAEAHRRGMRITGHCAHELPLVAAGTDAKEHAGFCATRSDGVLYDDLVQLYRAAGIGVVPTITYANFAVALNQKPDLLDADSALTPFVPPRDNFAWMIRLDSAGRKMFAGFGQAAALTSAKLARAGVTIGTGSDIWQIPTGTHQEMQELVAAGFTPLEAIHAATGASAKILGAEQDVGTIEVGKLADLVILDADPAADIRNTRKIWAVLQSGRLVDRAAIRSAMQAPTQVDR